MVSADTACKENQLIPVADITRRDEPIAKRNPDRYSSSQKRHDAETVAKRDPFRYSSTQKRDDDDETVAKRHSSTKRDDDEILAKRDPFRFSSTQKRDDDEALAKRAPGDRFEGVD